MLGINNPKKSFFRTGWYQIPIQNNNPRYEFPWLFFSQYPPTMHKGWFSNTLFDN
jgi:hypothetical protein